MHNAAMDDSAPVIIEVALNGGTKKERNPLVPLSPDEIAADAIACMDAGASVVHSHTDVPFQQARESEETAAVYAKAYRAVLAERPDAFLYPTIAGGSTVEARWMHYRLLADDGLIKAGAVDSGSVNLGAARPDGTPSDTDWVYVNSPADIKWMFKACADARVGPSIAVFEPGFLRATMTYHKVGLLPPGTFIKFYFSGRPDGSGGFFGMPPIPAALDLYLTMLDLMGGADLPWAVAVLGAS